jgi:uncharacterized membrane protein YedE/YeeE
VVRAEVPARLRRAQLRRLLDRVRQRGRCPDRERGGHGLDRQVAPARRPFAAIAAALVVAALAIAAFRLHDTRGRDASFALLAGFAFGAILQRSRFCMASAFRDLFLRRETRVALGLLAALAVGSVGYQVVFGAQLPDPTSGYVPPTAFIARVSWLTFVGGLSFGVGMVLAGGCISGQLWRLGEGAAASLVALAGVIGGQLLAQLAWNRLWVAVVAESPAVWLPRELGYGGALLLELALFAALAVLLLKLRPASAAPGAPAVPAEPASESATLQRSLVRFFVRPWSAIAGGAAIGVLATLVYFRGMPLGVTAELARGARSLGDALGWLPSRLEGLDQISGCRPPQTEHLLSERGLFVVALVAGSLAAALGAGEFRPRLARARALLLALVGGALLGFGAFLASGCTVGALLSGVMAGSLHGWVFAAGLAAGAALAVVVLRRRPADVACVGGTGGTSGDSEG